MHLHGPVLARPTPGLRSSLASLTRQRVKRFPPPSASDISSSSAGSDQLPAGHDRERRGTAQHLRVEREEQLVHQAGREQERVERGTALAQDRAHAVVAAQAGQQQGQVVPHPLVHHLLAGAGHLAVEPRWPPPPAAWAPREGQVRREVEAPDTTTASASRSSPSASRLSRSSSVFTIAP